MGNAPPTSVLGISLVQGAQSAVFSPTFFQEHNISHVVGFGRKTIDPAMHPEIPEGNVLFFRSEDAMPSREVASHFAEVAQFIHDARRQGGHVFVHCWDGVAVSTAVILAYFMTWLELDLATSLRTIKTTRRSASPTTDLNEELELWASSKQRKELHTQLLSLHEKEGSLYCDWDLFNKDLLHLHYHLWASDKHKEPLVFIGRSAPLDLPPMTVRLFETYQPVPSLAQDFVLLLVPPEDEGGESDGEAEEYSLLSAYFAEE